MGLITRREWMRRYCEKQGIPADVFSLAVQHMTNPRKPGYWDGLVDEATGTVPDRPRFYTWVRRNEDKPHRCPECHGVVTWDYKRYGPRTVLSCSFCAVRWRSGVRTYPFRVLRRSA